MMDFSEYQGQARRTQNQDLTEHQRMQHALFGLSAEVGEVLGLFQKLHQGHTLDLDALEKEMGDVLWMLAELADVYRMDLGEVAAHNIAKLRKRYPDGFDPEKSLHRQE